MNWKNLRRNPPEDNCTLATCHRRCSTGCGGYEIWGWNAAKACLQYCTPTGFQAIPFEMIPKDMHYIILDDIK